MRRPGLVAIGSSLVLLGLGAPALGTQFIGADQYQFGERTPTRVALDQITGDFHLTEVPITALVTGRGVATVRREIARLPTVTAVSAPQRLARDRAALIVSYSGRRFDPETLALLDDIRALDRRGTSVEVTGVSAYLADFQSGIKDRVPIAIAIIALAMLVVVFLMTGSIVLPFKMMLMSALTIVATFGVLTWIFQDGRLEGPLQFSAAGGLDTALAMFIFAAVYGLSTDYGIFLIARIRELHVKGLSNEEAVAIGLQRTGRVITGAALLLCVALGAIATSGLLMLKETGVGTAFAIALDATLVRCVLVPALMKLLGDLNWWAPAPLRRLHERIGLKEEPAESSAAASGVGLTP